MKLKTSLPAVPDQTTEKLLSSTPLLSCHSVVLSWGVSVTLSQVCDAFPFILSSSHQVRSVSLQRLFCMLICYICFMETLINFDTYQSLRLQWPKVPISCVKPSTHDFLDKFSILWTQSLHEIPAVMVLWMACLYNPQACSLSSLSIFSPRELWERCTGPGFGQEVSSFQVQANLIVHPGTPQFCSAPACPHFKV